ncbi:MAG: FAD-dependent oxidoreductase, partial [Anaerolineae bacterium]|nr:FAD-dependent oxidoreductase [Anaerolineae bacterium]
MNNTHYDVIVIGTGPGGEGAAMKASKEGKSVAIIEAFERAGGNCTHRGTIPSKALRQAIVQIANARDTRYVHYQDLLRTAESVIDRQVDMRTGFYHRNLIDLQFGRATFVDAHTIEVTAESGLKTRFSADAFVVATGSRPYHPPDVDFTHPRILDSDRVIDLTENPRSISIYGAGVIGCEYASIFRGLSIKVNLINTRSQLLAFLDDEIIDALSYHLRENGVLIRHNEEYERVEADDEGVTIYLKSNKQIRSDYLLWAQGRTGNSDDMGLEALGIERDSRGSIVVNENYQSAQPHIYAVGDVVGF